MIQKLILSSWFLLLSFSLSFAQTDSTISAKNSSALVPDSFLVTGKPISGMAATYSSKADGTKTTSGEIFFNALPTGGSNKFPIGTWVKVTNSKNGKWALVRINDRTSKKKSAPVIQLSRSVVSQLGFLRTGSTKIKLQKIDVNNYQPIFNVISDSAVLQSEPIPTPVQPDTVGYKIKGKSVNGIASFYSSNLDGTITATGERYRNNKLTAASNNFPLNTWVKVTSLFNGKSVVVRINDRMHPRMKKKGRVVDLSRAAANQLDFIARGITKVKVETIIWLKKDTLVKEQPDTLPVVTLTPDTLLHRDDTTGIVSDTTTKSDTDKNVLPKKQEGPLTGIASFYSSNLDGTKTATGEIFRNKKMTAASNQLPLNTWVRVTNLKNGRSVIVRINDRMHPRMKAKGRVVDLSRSAAQKLGFLKSGLTRVKVEKVKKGTLN